MLRACLLAATLGLSACATLPNPAAGLFGGERPGPAAPLAGLVPISEQALQAPTGIAAVAVWAGPGAPQLIVAAPEANELRRLDAASGALLGSAPLEGGPHRLTVIDDLVFVSLRETPSVAVLRLPDFLPLLRFGEGEDQPLVRPQGLWAQRMGDWGYHVYVADDYPQAGADSELRRRIKQYAVGESALGWTARSIRAFGELSGPGRLVRADALVGDAARERLLVADVEVDTQRRLKAYGFNGRWLGRSAGGGVFRSGVTGLALLACEGGRGYWLAADSGINGHYLHVFDREHLDHVGSASLGGPVSGIAARGGVVHAVRAGGLAALDIDGWLAAQGLPGCRG